MKSGQQSELRLVYDLDHLGTFRATQVLPGGFPNGLSHLGTSSNMSQSNQMVQNKCFVQFLDLAMESNSRDCTDVKVTRAIYRLRFY